MQKRTQYAARFERLQQSARLIQVNRRTEHNAARELLSSPMQSLSKFVTWSPDGATVATASESIFFQLWSAASLQRGVLEFCCFEATTQQ